MKKQKKWTLLNYLLFFCRTRLLQHPLASPSPLNFVSLTWPNQDWFWYLIERARAVNMQLFIEIFESVLKTRIFSKSSGLQKPIVRLFCFTGKKDVGKGRTNLIQVSAIPDRLTWIEYSWPNFLGMILRVISSSDLEADISDFLAFQSPVQNGSFLSVLRNGVACHIAVCLEISCNQVQCAILTSSCLCVCAAVQISF